MNQSNSYVNSTLLDWAAWYQNNFNFDAYRIDTVKHIDHPFWKGLRKVTNDWYNIGEIFVNSWDTISSYVNDQEIYSAFNYPLYYAIGSTIGSGGSMYQLRTAYNDAKNAVGDKIHDLGLFLENHDNVRFLTAYGHDLKRFENGLTLIHTWVGIPYLYYGAEQDMDGGADPDNRHALWDLGYSKDSWHY